ncbi:hypothetical protein SAMN05216553_11076 [Lentzea fradiae]|uniref:Uncharacterized protein n=1 Tax=Lentzea fradiae TaxID=200378 RepID=A0A1G7W0N0_9PSEU|nr:hypothetical protein SAMN05216553_11076 [Lentzea fradiae]
MPEAEQAAGSTLNAAGDVHGNLVQAGDIHGGVHLYLQPERAHGPPRPDASPRYYLYLSDAKVDMLLSQVDPDSTDVATDRLERVLEHLENRALIGTVDEPKQYVRGVMALRWDTLAEDTAVYFGGRTDRTVVGLGGSPGLVGVVDAPGRLHRQVQQPGKPPVLALVQSPLVEQIGQRPAVHPLGEHARLVVDAAHVHAVDDVGMRSERDPGTGLQLEPGTARDRVGVVGLGHLDREIGVPGPVPDPVHHTHSAGLLGAEHLVEPEKNLPPPPSHPRHDTNVS